MISTKLNPFLLIFLPSLFLTTSSALFSESHGHLQLSNKQSQGMNYENHMVLERKLDELANNGTVILAAQRTYRRDPLMNFAYYTGGWDYKNSHYWASLAFSAAPLFITATVWFLVLGLGLCLSCLYWCCCCCCCCRNGKKNYGYSQIAYTFSLIFLVLFTVAALSGCFVLYVNQENFSNSVADVLEFILKKGMSIFDNLMSVLTALTSAAKVSMDQLPLPADLQADINSVDQMIRSTANIPQIQSLATAKNIHTVLSPANLALNIVAAVMLILVVLGFIFCILGLRFCVFILVIIGWILVTMAFILCGIFLVFHNSVADTCVAIDEWLEDPNANAALSLELLPCMDTKTAKATLNTSREASLYLIDVANKYITDVANKQMPPNYGPLYHNQSGPLVPLLCNPYNPDLTDRKCAFEEVTFTNVSQEWKKYTCEVSAADICITTGRLTPKAYGELTASVNVSHSLYSSGEFLVELLDCSFVLKTFKEISEKHCPGLRHYSYKTYVGMVIIATSVMCSLIFWLLYARERQHRKRSKKFKAKQKRNPYI